MKKNGLWLITQIVKENIEHFELIIYEPKTDYILFSWNSDIDSFQIRNLIEKALKELKEDNLFGIIEIIYGIASALKEKDIEIEKGYGEQLCKYVELEKHINLKEKREIYSRTVVICPNNQENVERGQPDKELQEVANRLL